MCFSFIGWLSVLLCISDAMTTACGQPLASSQHANTIVTLHRLEVPPLSSLFPSEYRDWGLCASCGVQTHEVFLRRDGQNNNDGGVTSPASSSACADADAGTPIDNSDNESNYAADQSAEERVRLPMTIPGRIQLGRCLQCRPRRTKGKAQSSRRSRGKSQSQGRSTRSRSRTNDGGEPGSDDEVSDKSLFPDLLAQNDEKKDEREEQDQRMSDATTHTNTETTGCSSDTTETNGDDNDNDDDDASTVMTALTTSPALLSTPHPLTKTISHISHISHGSHESHESEPSQTQSLRTESSESSEETLWSIESGESEDSILRRVVSFAANTTTATYTTNDLQRSNTDGTANDTVSPPSPSRSALRYKRRTQDHESIGTSIATSLMSSHASFSSNSSTSSDDDSDEDTIVSGNCSPDRFDARRKSLLKKKLASGPPMPLSGAQRARSAPAAVPGKLAREWVYEKEDNFGSFLSSRGKRNISLPTNIDCMGGLERKGSTGTNNASGSGVQCRPKWTARSAILTHEEELQAMLQQQCHRKGGSADTNDSDGDESTIDSTSGDIGCMAARLRKQYGIHRISFASSGASTTSSSTDSSTSASDCSGDSGKASSLLSGVTASTAMDGSQTDDASSTSASSSRWMSQSQVAEKKSWNRKVMGFFTADKIFGRHRSTS